MLYDILLPVDKFTAAGAWLPCNWVVLHCVARVLMQPADVMREVTIYDTIEPQANYSAKVHSLAPFHASGHLDEIDDPLYGSTSRGGPEEVAAVTAAATLLDSCCEARALRRISHASAETDAETHPDRRALPASLRRRPRLRAWPAAPAQRRRLRCAASCARG